MTLELEAVCRACRTKRAQRLATRLLGILRSLARDAVDAAALGETDTARELRDAVQYLDQRWCARVRSLAAQES